MTEIDTGNTAFMLLCSSLVMLMTPGEWGDFHQNLIEAIARWERSHALSDPSWNYYVCWLEALEQTIAAAGSVSPEELNCLQ